MRFTCLIPTFNNGAMIRASIESVLAQTVADLELFVVCDGAPPETHEIAANFAASDRRVKVFKFEKGARHGEAWRHQALQEATGEAVCYLADDDYWFPDHLQVMATLLADADFAHTRHIAILPTFQVRAVPLKVTEPEARAQMWHGAYNLFGLSAAGHRLDAYRRLPEGWAPAPVDVATDLHMWRKWMRADGVRFAASLAITTLQVPRAMRPGQERDASAREADYWRAAMRDPILRQALRERAPGDWNATPLAAVMQRACELHAERAADAAARQAELQRVYASRTWRYALPFRRAWRGLRDLAKLDG